MKRSAVRDGLQLGAKVTAGKARDYPAMVTHGASL